MTTELHLGDCLDILPTLDEDSIDMIFTDPPFNLGKDYDGKVDDSRSDYYEWCSKWIKMCFSLLKKGGAFYLMTAQEHTGAMMLEMEKYAKFRNLIIWHNSSTPVKNKFCVGYQPILYYVKRGADSVFNYGAEQRTSPSKFKLPSGKENNARSIKDIWDDIKCVTAGIYKSKEAILEAGTNRKAHPAQMPIRLPHRAVVHSTNKDDVVLDPFMGSGTTGVACAFSKRDFIGIDLVEKYCSLAEKRIKRAEHNALIEEQWLNKRK